MSRTPRRSAVSLPSPPLALARVIRIAGDPDRSLAELARTCAQDPGLTLELIRVANAARYSANAAIKSVPQAVLKLGARAVRSHALTYALRTATLSCQTGGFSPRRFWEDSLRRACAARVIAEALGDSDPHEAFAVGICQDLGALLLAIRRPDLGETLGDLRRRPGEARRQAERVLCGRDHSDELLDSPMAEMLPEEMREAIRHHHAPAHASGRAGELARIAWAADQLADVAQALPKSVALERADAALTAIGLPDQLGVLYKAVRRALAQDAAELAIPVSEQASLAQLRDQAQRAVDAMAAQQKQQARRVVRRMVAPRAPVTRNPLAARDPLTALDSRRNFEEAAQLAVERANGLGRPLTLLIGDLDHFRQVNDTWGTAAGDAVLREVARRLSSAVGIDARVGRIGGEEFGIVLPNTGPSTARVLAERLRLSVARKPIEVPGGTVSITLSLGAATAEAGGCPPSALALLDRADRAMLGAKRAGRDQVAFDVLEAQAARAAV